MWMVMYAVCVILCLRYLGVGVGGYHGFEGGQMRQTFEVTINIQSERWVLR